MQKDIEKSIGNQALLKTFSVCITETLQLTFEVQAENEEQAEQIIADKWENGKCILNAENFVDVDFEIFPPD